MNTALEVGHFTIHILDEIGAGGLGRVNRVRIASSNAVDKPVGSEWAIKRLNAQWQYHPEARERFEREIKVLFTMAHENVVTCAGVNLPGYERFYMMPLYTRSVRQHIANGGNRGEWRNVAAFGAILCRALDYAHGMGFIHRDVKPENVLFNPGGPLVIADWGIGYFIHKASTVLQPLTRGGMGTEYYCSAEQWASGKCGGTGDTYSLGMTLDEWLTGRQRQIAIGAGLAGSLPVDQSFGAMRLNMLLQRMTRPRAADRPATLGVVATELEHIAKS
jgi:serine/threonine-protein kinase PpkA